MPVPTITIRVVVHRLFGTAYEWMESGRGPFGSGSTLDPEPLLPRPELRSFTDRTHGTARTSEEVQALFGRVAGYEYPGDRTLDDMFDEVGVHFSVMGVVDDAIESHIVDLVPQPELDRVAERLNVPDALNVYLVRAISGAYGMARTYSRDRTHHPTSVFLSDENLGRSSPASYFGTSLITLAHELGHVLGLPHMPEPSNVMYTFGGGPVPHFLDVPQSKIARSIAARMARDLVPVDLDQIIVGVPDRGRFRSWNFDPGVL